MSDELPSLPTQRPHNPWARVMVDETEHNALLMDLDEWLAIQPPETLEMLLVMLGVSLQNDDVRVPVVGRISQVTTILQLKHGRCVCGSDHEAEALKQLKREQESGHKISDGVWRRFEAVGQYGVISVDVDLATKRFRCIHCGAIYASYEARFVDGPNCAKCGEA